MKPLSYWVSNPDIREYAIPLVETNMPRKAVVEAIIEKFGVALAPTCDEQISKLRMQVAKGKWRTDKISPKGRNDNVVGRSDSERMSGTEAAPTTDTTTAAPKERAGTPATTVTRFKRPYGNKTFWDNHPTLMRFAARLIQDEDCNIQHAIEKRFGAKFRPETQQLKMLREGLETGRFTATAVSPKTLSEPTLRLFSSEQATECLIPGIKLWTRIHCVKRQLRFRIGRHEMSWNDGMVSRQSRRVLTPELALCAKCVNWIPASDLRILRRKIQKGFEVEAR